MYAVPLIRHLSVFKKEKLLKLYKNTFNQFIYFL